MRHERFTVGFVRPVKSLYRSPTGSAIDKREPHYVSHRRRARRRYPFDVPTQRIAAHRRRKRDRGTHSCDYLNSIGITHLNGVIATHPDSDHIGGLITVLGSMQVDHVYDVGLPKTSATYATFLQLIAQKNITYTQSRAGDNIAIDSDTAVFVIIQRSRCPRQRHRTTIIASSSK